MVHGKKILCVAAEFKGNKATATQWDDEEPVLDLKPKTKVVAVTRIEGNSCWSYFVVVGGGREEPAEFRCLRDWQTAPTRTTIRHKTHRRWIPKDHTSADSFYNPEPTSQIHQTNRKIAGTESFSDSSFFCQCPRLSPQRSRKGGRARIASFQ